jgi:4-aminobutyrate aminotransferase-like enzyme
VSETLKDRRRRLLGPNLPTFYEDPVHLVRGQGTRVWDAAGREYLDCYNNVPHVGHCHPRVVEAICREAGTLNTHTRYLHETILDYAEALTAIMGPGLESLILTCTGSEANDVALRMARAATGHRGIIATDHTYHGNTDLVSRLSRTNPPPGDADPAIRFVPAPDSYRRPDDGTAFGAAVAAAVADLSAAGQGIAALIVCPYFANEGFPDTGPGWLDAAAAAVRAAGGVVIADEVQPGFGRLGTHMWGYQRVGLVPEIVTLGKPMANGHPVGAVVTSDAIMSAFRESFRYFNTFGGNPVSACAALETLRVIRDEGLMENAAAVGDYARAGLRDLAGRHACIGDVRGAGLFFGAEMVLDRATKAPATAFAKRVANGMRARGVLLNFLGIHANVLKIRPPMPFSRADADRMLAALDDTLAATPLCP